MDTVVPILGFAAFSGTGKTTLLEQVIPELCAAGLNIGVVKASHHTVEPDPPGKDSYRLRHAGALQTVLSTPGRAICVTERQPEEPVLEQQLALLDQSRLDLIIVEGFRDAVMPKIELHRSGLDRPYIYPQDKNIIALCQDSEKADDCHLPQLDINQPQQVVNFILDFVEGSVAHKHLA